MKNSIYLSLVTTLLFSCGNNAESIKSYEANASVNLSPDNLDLGRLNHQKTKTFTFTISNPTTKSLEINSVTKSCGCTSILMKSKRIKPNSSVKVSVVYNPKKDHGNIQKSVVMRSSESDILVFRFKAFVL